MFAVPLVLLQVQLRIRPYPQLGAEPGVGRMTVLWQAAPGARYLFSYSQDKNKVELAPKERLVSLGEKSFSLYSVDLRGLAPDSQVRYDVTSGGVIVDHGSLAVPPLPGRPYSFAVVGDMGRGTEEEARVAFRLGSAHPAMTLLTGDIVYDDGRQSEYDSSFYPYYSARANSARTGANVLQSSLCVPVVGNHDTDGADLAKNADGLAYYYNWSVPANGPKAPGAAPKLAEGVAAQAFLKNAAGTFPQASMYSFDFGDSHWTVLDSNEYVDWTNAGLQAWVRRDILGSNARWKFVAFHHPGFHTSKKHQSQKQMRVLHPLFEECRVDVVFCGHVHNYQRTKPIRSGGRALSAASLETDDWATDEAFDGKTNTRPKGIVYVTSGGGGAYLYDPDLEFRPAAWKPFMATYRARFSYTLANCSPNRLEVRQVDLNGALIDRFTITK